MAGKAILLLLLLCKLCTATNFTQCFLEIQNNLTNLSASDYYYGPVKGKLDSAPPLTVLTQRGCKKACGTGTDFNDRVAAFNVLATWILPSLALFSQLPYESLSLRDFRNAKALLNWIGSPAAACTTTAWNIQMIHQCRVLSQTPLPFGKAEVRRDVLYILSCVNQYQYPRRGTGDLRRDTALLRGILFPFVAFTEIDNDNEERLETLAQHLAFQLRIQRRPGIWPLGCAIFWFLLSLLFSVVVAFDTALGDNSTAHSLSIGLLLSFLPVLVFAAFVDRNPNSSAQCAVLIEDWLWQVDSIFERSIDLRIRLAARRDSTADNVDDHPFYIGDFVGQGRKLRYCAVTSMVLQDLTRLQSTYVRLPPRRMAYDFADRLPVRPWLWYLYWLLSGAIVSLSFGSAFAMTYRTPVVGIGCRCFSYIIWFVPSMASWILLGIFQEPSAKIRAVTYITNGFSTLALMMILLAQTTNAFNNCFCRSVAFEGNLWEGYMFFENGAFIQQAFNVRKTWGIATAFGLTTCAVTLSWLGWRYEQDKSLWEVDERKRMSCARCLLPDGKSGLLNRPFHGTTND